MPVTPDQDLLEDWLPGLYPQNQTYNLAQGGDIQEGSDG